MRHLNYVIAFTGRFDAMRRFYERGLGLAVRRAEPDWVEFDNAGASFALHRMDDPARQELTLRFVTANLDAALADLRGRGLEPDGEPLEFRGGRLAQFWDADHNLLTLLEPATPAPSGAGEPISPLILNVSDMRAAVAFYRDRFGIPVQLESPWWTELDTGATRVALHPRGPAARGLRHNDQPIVVGFEVPSLEELGRELAERGLVYSGGPVEERQNRFAEVLDPDGRVVLFRQSPSSGIWQADDDEEAEPFEDAPTHAAMRKPGSKKAKATSRVVVKPVYRRKKSGRTSKPKHPAKSAAVKTNTRLKVKPPTGRLKKAERRAAVRKKTAVAAASRGKPVKRASAKKTVTKRGGTSRAKAKRSSARRSSTKRAR
jgi:catechol 2,3-dioxygenase-like lactoylglutathione lyase family enzyme